MFWSKSSRKGAEPQRRTMGARDSNLGRQDISARTGPCQVAEAGRARVERFAASRLCARTAGGVNAADAVVVVRTRWC